MASKSSAIHTQFISRQDIKYFIMFIAGILGAFVAGQLSAFFASYIIAQTYLLPAGSQGYSPTNIAMFILVLTLYTAGAGLAMVVAKWLVNRRKPINLTLGMITVLILFLLLLVAQALYVPWIGPNLAVWNDLLTVIATGGIYAVGWWAAQRYTR